jgi:hypothetical protein
MESERNLRFNVNQDLYDKIVKVQGLLSFKESRKVSMQDAYSRILERGCVEILKHNR